MKNEELGILFAEIEQKMIIAKGFIGRPEGTDRAIKAARKLVRQESCDDWYGSRNFRDLRFELDRIYEPGSGHYAGCKSLVQYRCNCDVAT